MADDSNGWKGMVSEKLDHMVQQIEEVKRAVNQQSSRCLSVSSDYLSRLAVVEIEQRIERERGAAIKKWLIGAAVVVVATAVCITLFGKK